MKIGQSGMGLAQVLIAASIMAVLAIGVATMLSNMNQEISFANARVASLGLGQDIRAAFSATANCNAVMQNKSVAVEVRTAEGKQEFASGLIIPSIGNLKPGESLPNYGVIVEEVYLTNFSSLGSAIAGITPYTADLMVRLKAPSGTRGMRPIVASKLTLGIDGSARISQCIAEGGSNAPPRPPSCKIPQSGIGGAPTTCVPAYETLVVDTPGKGRAGDRVEITGCSCAVSYYDNQICTICTNSNSK